MHLRERLFILNSSMGEMKEDAKFYLQRSSHPDFDGSTGLELPVSDIVVVAECADHPHHQAHLRPDLPDL